MINLLPIRFQSRGETLIHALGNFKDTILWGGLHFYGSMKHLFIVRRGGLSETSFRKYLQGYFTNKETTCFEMLQFLQRVRSGEPHKA